MVDYTNKILTQCQKKKERERGRITKRDRKKMGEREKFEHVLGKASLMARSNLIFVSKTKFVYIWFTVCHVWLFVDPGPNIPHWTIDRFTVTLSSKRPLTTDLHLTLALLASLTRRLPWPWDPHSSQLPGKFGFFLPAGFISKNIVFESFKERSGHATRGG